MKTESGDVIRFIKKGSIFLLALFLLDFLIGMGISGLFSKQKGGQIYQTTMGLESVHTDVLVFGASNASHHYVPSVFRDSLGMSFFNLGRDGMDILYGKAIFNGIVRRYCPKIIIINLSPTELSTDLSYDRLSPLLPYYRDRERRGDRFVPGPVPEVFHLKEPALFVENESEMDFLVAEAEKGYVGLGVIPQSFVMVVKGLKYHAFTAFPPGAGTSIAPSLMTALKNLASIWLSKSISWSIQPRSLSPL